MEEKLCPECGKPIYGRQDKKFCSDSCRNAYNNKLNADTVNHVRNINNILRKNRRILETLNPDGKATIPKKKLQEKGFDFNYFTSIYQTKAGDEYRFCYEHGYLTIEGDRVLLVKRSDA